MTMEKDPETTDPFDRCDFYTCREPDLLSLASPEEAIEECLDGHLPDGDTVAAILRHDPITVVGYMPKTIPDRVVLMLARDALERIDETLGEDYADPDGDNLFRGAVADECIAELTQVIRRACNRAQVWSCEEIGTRTYSPVEVLTMMREHCPEWFETDHGSTDPGKSPVQP